MISPADIRQKADRWWADQSLLRAWLDGVINEFFPKSIGQIGLENEAELVANFSRIRVEQETLRLVSKSTIGYGYTLDWQRKQKRSLGRVGLISRISFETLDDYLRFTDREQTFAQFVSLVEQTRQQVPELEPWLRKHPLRLLENASDWPNWLLICRFFIDTYQPGHYYVRQLPLPVHTKFLEEHSGLLLSLLATIKPDLLRPEHTNWRKKLGLLVPESMIRVRALDDALRLAGQYEDFGLPLSVFARHVQPAERIFICENLLNFLTLPNLPNAVAIWSGGGFNIECLAEVDWLRDRQIVYWGDLDAHGFQILNQCKGYFPRTRALLMDQATFDRHYHLKGAGKETDVMQLPHLTDDEWVLFEVLKRNKWRIEQERLDQEWVAGRLKDEQYPAFLPESRIGSH